MKNADQLRTLFARLGVAIDLELITLGSQVIARIQSAPDRAAIVKTMLRRALDDSPRVVMGQFED